jgi:DNA-binding transcriptional ArsR family regulator
MDADVVDGEVARVAAAIGEPARARMLFGVLDGRARTSTELAALAGVTASTASAHLQRLVATRLVQVDVQGRHRYYSLAGARVARALEALSVVAGRPRDRFVPSTPNRLRAARTCYDHLAGTVAVALHDRFLDIGWLAAVPSVRGGYELTGTGERACAALGVDVAAARATRRRFAFACLDWSERRPHIGGALGAALLAVVLKRRWVGRDLDSRALAITAAGRRELRARFGVQA